MVSLQQKEGKDEGKIERERERETEGSIRKCNFFLVAPAPPAAAPKRGYLKRPLLPRQAKTLRTSTFRQNFHP